MNINSISCMNFKAHIKDDYEKEYLMRHFLDIGVSNEQIKDCDIYLNEHPDAEIAIEAVDADDYKTYIQGNITTPKGKSEEFCFEDYNDNSIIYSFGQKLAEITNKLSNL